MQRKPLFSRVISNNDGDSGFEIPEKAHAGPSAKASDLTQAPAPDASGVISVRSDFAPKAASQSRSTNSGPTLVSRVKAALPLVEYAKRHMELKPASGGKGEFTGKCPDPGHDDKNASFYASSVTDAYLCHGCGIAGNVIHLHALFNGLDYNEAKIELGRELGVFNERVQNSTESMMMGTARKYIDQLRRKDDAWKYLTNERKLTPESIEKFGIGFCWGNEGRDMTPAEKEQAVAYGLLRPATETSPEKSFMSARITFPVRDKVGRVVGFGGRLVPSEFKSYGPKYMNSPETEIFKKSELLYGAYEAAHGISKSGYAVVLEGYMDVVATHQSGVDNTVAVMGAFANESTFANLWSMTKRVVFCLDGDAAGDKGTLRSVLAAAPTMPPGCEIAIAKLPAGVDPDEFVIAHGGDAFKTLCENAMPLSRFLMEQSARYFDLSYPEGRAAFIAEAVHVSSLFTAAPVVGEQIVAEARSLNAAGLTAYALSSNHIDDSVETGLLRDAIAMLQATLKSRTDSVHCLVPKVEPGIKNPEQLDRTRPHRKP